MTHQETYITLLQQSIHENTFVKIALGNYKGDVPELKNVYIKKIQVKQHDKLSFTYRYKTKDIVKNFDLAEGVLLITNYIATAQFKHAALFTLTADVTLDQAQKPILKQTKPTHTQLESLQHNVPKNRIIGAEGKAYLHHLKITDDKGNVNPTAQDKFKQINKYVELLSPLIKNLPTHQTLKVVDMGAGKGYLTFALYDYLTNVLATKAQVVGVEYRPDLVTLCNTIAQKATFDGLSFVQGTIKEFETEQLHVLIALHACDTATDDAIYKGISANAQLIVVAPCCHKQIRRQLEQHKTKNELDFMLKHGIFLERQAEMLTDGMRALLLEYFDYTTKVVEFIAGEHTPKNVMIIAEKKPKTPAQKQELLQKIKATKLYFGIEKHYLEEVMGVE
ncbi:MAG: SAM-dependent methyltransferase [Bacteroidia bacterium]